MRKLSRFCALLAAVPAFAHVVSMSTGELQVSGAAATFELRIPMYEVAHVARPETALLDRVTFAGAVRKSATCAAEGEQYICRATYEFPAPIDRVRVSCTLFEVTVPNHVHILRATQGENSDQAVFDQSFKSAEIRFRPPSPAERFVGDAVSGFARAATSIAGALFLIALVAASRSLREAALLGAMFLIGEWLARPIAPRIPWPLSTRFIEAAMALTVAYLAVEMIALPLAGQRWAVVLMLGLFHGLYFAGFPATYLVGAGVLQVVALAMLAWLWSRAPKPATRSAGWGLLVAGLGWFVVRVAS